MEDSVPFGEASFSLPWLLEGGLTGYGGVLKIGDPPAVLAGFKGMKAQHRPFPGVPILRNTLMKPNLKKSFLVYPRVGSIEFNMPPLKWLHVDSKKCVFRCCTCRKRIDLLTFWLSRFGPCPCSSWIFRNTGQVSYHLVGLRISLWIQLVDRLVGSHRLPYA